MHYRKAGITAQALKWAVPTLIFFLASLTIINFLEARYTALEIDTTAMHAQQIAWRGLDALSYEERHTMLVKPMIIDAEKLEKAEELLDSSIRFPEPRYAARFLIGPETVYFNRQWFDRLLPLKGLKQGVRSYLYTYPITLKDGADLQASIAQIEVLAVP